MFDDYDTFPAKTYGFIDFLTSNYSLPDEVIDLVQSYISILGEPDGGDLEGECFVTMFWQSEDLERAINCVIFDDENVAVSLIDGEVEINKSDDDLLELKNWLET